MDDLFQAIKWYYNIDPVINVMGRIDKVQLTIVPIYLYMYVSEIFATAKAFARTFKEKTCNKHYCKQSHRAIQIIKFIWLLFVPLLLIVSPRRLHLPQAIFIVIVSVFMYISAVRTAASCFSSLMITAVRTPTYLISPKIRSILLLHK